MQDGECYVQSSSTTIYAFPDLSCDEGSPMPSTINAVRDTYYSYNGRLVFSNRQRLNSNYEQYGGYIAHINHNTSLYWLDYNSLVLPATLFVLAFMSVIYKWFIRLRG